MADIPMSKTDWPMPSGRWRSFEAEAWPVTAYRYDSRTPNIIDVFGEHCVNGTGRANPFIKCFGTATIFTSGSRRGAQHYLSHDANPFFFHNMPLEFYKKKFMLAEEEYQKSIPCLYKVKTDSHSSISFKDMFEEFGDNFSFLTGIGVRRPLSRDGASEEAKFREMVREYPALIQTHSDHIRNIYNRNDEIHIRGPIRRSRVDRAHGASPFEFAGQEWLDLAVL